MRGAPVLDAVPDPAGHPGRPVLLVIRPTGLGDLVMGIPALRALRRAFPEHSLVTTCPSALVPLAERIGVVDRFVTEHDAGAPLLDPSRHRGTEAAVLEAVFTDPAVPDVVVVLKMPEDEINRRAAARRPRVHIAYRHPDVPATAAFPVYDEDHHVLARWELLLGPYGIHPDRADLFLDVGVAATPEDTGDTVVHLGSGSGTRRWPVERWAAVARALTDLGRTVVFTGSVAEGSLVTRARELAGLPVAADRSGTTILELARLIAHAGQVLSVDSGVAHLATVLRRRAVTLFGPTPPAWWGPPPGDPRHRVLWRGRRGEPYGPSADPGLLEIGVDEVVGAATAPW